MRKLVTAGFIALFAALAAPTAAFALTVSDTFVFSNQTTAQWTMTSNSITGGGTGGDNHLTKGTDPVNGGGMNFSSAIENDQYGVTFDIVWTTTDVNQTTCHVHGVQSKNQYGNWQIALTGGIGGYNPNNYSCYATPPGTSGHTGFTLNYKVY